MVERLVELGCSVSAADAEGATPWHLAAQGACPELMLLLLKHGCQLEAATHDGRTALHYAASTGQTM